MIDLGRVMAVVLQAFERPQIPLGTRLQKGGQAAFNRQVARDEAFKNGAGAQTYGGPPKQGWLCEVLNADPERRGKTL